jgi:tetratricopeptide (TPR) repeat protein
LEYWKSKIFSIILSFHYTINQTMKVFGFAILLFTGPLVSAQTLKDAIRLTVNEQYEEATSVFITLIQREPLNATNYFYYGQNFIEQEDLDSARIIFQKGTEIDAKNPLNLIGLGEALLNDAKVSESNMKYEKALKAYSELKAEYDRSANKTEEMRTAVQIALTNSEKVRTESEQEKVKIDQANVNFEKALVLTGAKNSVAFIAYARALTSSKNKFLEKAMEYIDKAISLDSRSVDAYIVKGDIYTEKNLGSDAAVNYNKALDIDKISTEAILRKGILYRRTTSYDVAIETLNEAIKIDPSFAPAYREMGENYYLKGNVERAKDEYKKYLSLSKNNFSARLRYASLLFRTKDYQNALNEAQQLLKMNPENITAIRIKAYAALETGDYKLTKETLDMIFKKVEKSKIAERDLEYYGKALQKVNDDSTAAIYYRQAYDMDSTRIDLLNEIASIFFKTKRYQDAAMAYKEKVNLGVGVKAADYYGLGQSYFFIGEYQSADSAFAKLNELSPKWPSGFLWRAKANYFLDTLKLELAKPYYERYIELALEDSANASKYKSGLIESYKLLADYAFRHKQPIEEIDRYFKKVLELDPADKEALNYFEQKRRQAEKEKAKKKTP